jgi:MFS superfamily sulfate permease-like transporter
LKMRMTMSFRRLLSDISASIVVYLVALPLCLGVALASETKPITGLIAGIVGGIVVGLLSKSPLSVSGPAAGLTAIVAGALGSLASFDVFLLSLVIAGFLQIGFGFLQAGKIADYIPYSVIKGMLAAIGIILILKQIPYFVGYASTLNSEVSLQASGIQKFYTDPLQAINKPHAGAFLIGGSSILILLLFEWKPVKTHAFLRYFPGPLMAVISGTLINFFFQYNTPDWFLQDDRLVNIPVFDSPSLLISSLSFPDINAIGLWKTWSVAIVIAIIAGIETLLSIEAIDKLDPEKRITPPNHELKAQGVGNIVSGLLGGLPVTSVIVRSSANVDAGARTKYSTVLHGILILASLVFFPHLLNLIPLASLSAILIVTGYKLTKPQVFLEIKNRGIEQFIPFLITIAAILETDLLKGVFIGVIVSFIFGVRRNFIQAVTILKDKNRLVIQFGKEVSFLNEGVIKNQLRNVQKDMRVYLDETKAISIDRDIIICVNQFIAEARQRGIYVYVRHKPGTNTSFFKGIEEIKNLSDDSLLK